MLIRVEAPVTTFGSGVLWAEAAVVGKVCLVVVAVFICGVVGNVERAGVLGRLFPPWLSGVEGKELSCTGVVGKDASALGVAGKDASALGVFGRLLSF